MHRFSFKWRRVCIYSFNYVVEKYRPIIADQYPLKRVIQYGWPKKDNVEEWAEHVVKFGKGNE